MADDQPKAPDFSDLRVRTLQQAKAELPQPKITPPWEEEPKLPATDPLGKAYEHAKAFLAEHEQHLSDKILKPFRTGLDNMADEIENSPYVKAASPVAKGVVSGVTNLMRSVPVGKDVKETVQAMAVPPELGPEERAALKGTQFEGLRVRPASEPKFVSPHPEYETSPPGSPAYKQINDWADRAAKGDEAAIASLKKIAGQKMDAQDAKFAQQKLTALQTKPTSEATVAAGGTGAASSEELARSNVYVKYSKSGQPTYLGKSPDASLQPGEAILAVDKKTGAVTVQNTSGLADSDALSKFGAHAKKNFSSQSEQPKVKPIKYPNEATKGLKEPTDKNKIVIEGIDEPKKPEGKYSDKIKIDPFAPGYSARKKPVVTT
jgi:hypothetical protein